MNALVEPLPLVPAMWMRFSLSKSEGCDRTDQYDCRETTSKDKTHTS